MPEDQAIVPGGIEEALLKDQKNKLLASRIEVGNWIHTERQTYADKKYNDKQDIDVHMQEDKGIGDDSWYWGFIGNYLKRAQLQGLDSEIGRQALGKAIVTCIEALESSVRIFGRMPVPGLPSGEIRKNV